jgi:hypothetical protein
MGRFRNTPEKELAIRKLFYNVPSLEEKWRQAPGVRRGGRSLEHSVADHSGRQG